MTKSRDAFRTISEVAEWLDTPAHVLRFWESKFTQVKPVKRAGGRRYYRPADMSLLGGIKKLLHDDGMTIKGVQKVLREKGVRHVAGLSLPVAGEVEEEMVLGEARVASAGGGRGADHVLTFNREEPRRPVKAVDNTQDETGQDDPRDQVVADAPGVIEAVHDAAEASGTAADTPLAATPEDTSPEPADQAEAIATETATAGDEALPDNASEDSTLDAAQESPALPAFLSKGRAQGDSSEIADTAPVEASASEGPETDALADSGPADDADADAAETGLAAVSGSDGDVAGETKDDMPQEAEAHSLESAPTAEESDVKDAPQASDTAEETSGVLEVGAGTNDAAAVDTGVSPAPLEAEAHDASEGLSVTDMPTDGGSTEASAEEEATSDVILASETEDETATVAMPSNTDSEEALPATEPTALDGQESETISTEASAPDTAVTETSEPGISVPGTAQDETQDDGVTLSQPGDDAAELPETNPVADTAEETDGIAAAESVQSDADADAPVDTAASEDNGSTQVSDPQEVAAAEEVSDMDPDTPTGPAPTGPLGHLGQISALTDAQKAEIAPLVARLRKLTEERATPPL